MTETTEEETSKTHSSQRNSQKQARPGNFRGGRGLNVHAKSTTAVWTIYSKLAWPCRATTTS